ncbi:hypothetical protein ITP53_36035 [Nonomuraea sp. K274]|uniref:Thiopeptide-type bacteriocin biosynthesis domain-containing protein n=1 Tax=Nonomuraea cypriaca TaxID=1187855 RepID=A0A931AIC2_9ACTN|nr:thiopeptide maturation pyridine synthase [Nonomuraea cypriaca]MBF8191028.1 hypothetical protein [Nonomuraea cypriaca]
MRWYTFRVHYYADGKEQLVLRGIRPLLAHLAKQVPETYYVPHWLRGPHVRIRVRCSAETLAEIVQPAVHRFIGEFLAESPSTQVLVPEEHLRAHRRLAELEGESGPLLPWHPDNSVELTDDEGGEPAHPVWDALLADFYTDSTGLAFAMTEDIAGGGPRLGLAFDLMIATAHKLSGVGLARGAISFRSHAEAFLHGYPEGDGRRETWDEYYRRGASTLVAQVREIVGALDGTGAPLPYIGEWTGVLAAYRERADALIAAGELDTDAAPEQEPDVVDLTQVSPFHRELFGTSAWQEQTEDTRWFRGYKLLLNYTYLHLTRLGVSPAERFLLCHLAAGAVEEAHGMSALELVRTLADPSLTEAAP